MLDLKKCVGIKLAILMFLFGFTPFANATGNFHIGTLEIHPFASLAEKYDDNVFLEPEDQDSDWVTTYTLGAGLKTPLFPSLGRDFKFKAKYNMDIVEFSDLQSSSRVDHTISSLTTLNFVNDLFFKIKEDFQATADPPNNELTALDRRTKNTLGAIFGRKRGEDLGYEFSYTNVNHEYNTSNGLDRTEHINAATGYYRLFAKTSALAEYNLGFVDYDGSATNSDSYYHQWRTGLKGSIGSKFLGVIKGGFKFTNYEEDNKDDFKGFTLYGNVKYKLQKRSNLTLSGSRAIEESSYSSNSYYLSNKLGLNFDHQLRERLFCISAVSLEFSRYPDDTTEGTQTHKRKDDIWSTKVGLRYEMKDWVNAEVSYTYKQRESSFAEYDYKDNKVLTKVNLLF